MRMILSILLALFFTGTSSIILYDNQESDNHSAALQLPLYQVRQLQSDSPQMTLPFSETLILDDARIQFSRLSGKRNLTSSLDDESVHVPVMRGPQHSIYFTQIRIGSSPTTHSLVIDTGSTLTWIHSEHSAIYPKVPCWARQCIALEQATRNPRQCPDPQTCVYTASYADGSISTGYLGIDILNFGSESRRGFVFGWGMANQNLFGMPAGMMGMANDELSFWYQLSHKYGKAFAYCLPTVSEIGEIRSGGFLSIGTSSNFAYKFTPMIHDSRDLEMYFIKLKAVSVAGKKLILPNSDYNVPMLLDSGSSYSLFASPVYSFLKKKLVRIISPVYRKIAGPTHLFFDTCFVGSWGEISGLVPPVQLIFEGGVKLNLAPHNVIIEVEREKTCLSFADSSKVGHSPIIGNHQQQTFSIMYDIRNGRIGFASGGCH